MAHTIVPQASKISLRQVSKFFGAQRVLDQLDLDVSTGESLVIMGGSGVGKSVLLKCILGLIPPSSGSIHVDGTEGCGLSGRAYEAYLQKFGMLFQGSALFDSLPVWENIVFGLRQTRKIKGQDALEIAVQAMGSVGLHPDVAFSFPAELSGGMQRRVAIARAIVMRPQIIFFDEPTAGLDPIISNVINELIVECSEKLGATSITITHDINSARKIAKNIAMIHGGKIMWRGAVGDLDHSGNPYVDQFIHGRVKGPIETHVHSNASRRLADPEKD